MKFVSIEIQEINGTKSWRFAPKVWRNKGDTWCVTCQSSERNWMTFLCAGCYQFTETSFNQSFLYSVVSKTTFKLQHVFYSLKRQPSHTVITLLTFAMSRLSQICEERWLNVYHVSILHWVLWFSWRSPADLSSGERGGHPAGGSQWPLCGHEPQRKALRIRKFTGNRHWTHTPTCTHSDTECEHWDVNTLVPLLIWTKTNTKLNVFIKELCLFRHNLENY